MYGNEWAASGSGRLTLGKYPLLVKY